MDNIAAICNYV